MAKRLVPNTLVVIKIADINTASYNPPSRAEKAPTSILAKSMSMLGMLAPLIVTPDYKLIDGHRRLAVAVARGDTEIEVVVRDMDMAVAYSAVNTTQARMTGNDMLYLYFNDGALTDIQKGKCSRADEILGKVLLRRLLKERYSLNVLDLALQAARLIYGDEFDNKFVRRAVEWIMEHGVPTMRKAVEGAATAATIRAAVEDMEELELTLARKRTKKRVEEPVTV